MDWMIIESAGFSRPPRHIIKRSKQFDIAAHYNAMEQLDRDVHDNVELSRSEAELALKLVGHIPERVFLPCFGTGRHIPHLLEQGVKSIVGVDLSPKCVAKARTFVGDDSRVQLKVGDLREWETDEQFDTVLLLGNSFGDLIDRNELAKFTRVILTPLASGGEFVMDYIGTGYLLQCARFERFIFSPLGNLLGSVDSQFQTSTTVWSAEIEGVVVWDHRTPYYHTVRDRSSLYYRTGIMTIEVNAFAKNSGELLYEGFYQKQVMPDRGVEEFFRKIDMQIRPTGIAHELNPYYQAHGGELGMIAKSTWWVGKKQ